MLRCNCRDAELQFLQLRPSKTMVTKMLQEMSVLKGKEGQKCACGEGNDAYRHTFEAIS